MKWDIPYKLKSVKLWSFVALAILAVVLLWFGKIESDQFVILIQWIFSILVLGNVASKYAKPKEPPRNNAYNEVVEGKEALTVDRQT